MNAEFTDLKVYRSRSEEAFSIGFGNIKVDFGDAGGIILSFSLSQSQSGNVYVSWPGYKKKGNFEKGKDRAYHYLPTGTIKSDLEKYILEEFNKVAGVIPTPKKKSIPIGQSQQESSQQDDAPIEPQRKSPIIQWRKG